MRRREFLTDILGILLTGSLTDAARANVPVPYDWHATPPMDSRSAFIDWMMKYRREDPELLGERFDRFEMLVSHHDVWSERNKRAYLLTPREDFVTKANRSRAYEWHYLDIGYGVTITGPHTVARMTNTIDPQFGEKVLEVGTGSGYQAAYLSNLTDTVWSIEIVRPLYGRTGDVLADLIARGYTEYKAINRKNDDGYYGWPEFAPFDKIIVTCGIDHVPPPLMQQLKPNGIMVIPIGPPGAQHVLKIVKHVGSDGAITVARSDIYNGSIVNFVPFTRLEGTHNR
jgi:protein-L-isoaspartate(D-aspartate) O-methyltransferase